MKTHAVRSTPVVLVAVMFMVCLAQSEAAMPLKQSDLFPKKFEMNVAAGEVDPAGNTAEWTRGSSGTFAASLSGGFLNLDTSGAVGVNAYWESATWAALSDNTKGFTVEARVRVDTSIDSGGSGGTDRTFQIFVGDGQTDSAGALAIGKFGTYWYNGWTHVLLNSQTNSDAFHVFRVAQDANTAQFQIWRDDVQIGTNVTSIGITLDYLWFGDGTGSFGGTGAFDYVRWDYTGGYSIPEPASVVLLGLSGLVALRFRRTR